MSQKNDLQQMEFFQTSLPGDSHAKTFQLPVSRKVSKQKGQGYGQSAPEYLGSFDLISQSLRTSQRSLVESQGNGFSEFSGTFPRSGMMQNGTVYQLPNLAHTITEIGCGLFATPRACNAMAANLTPELANHSRENLETQIAKTKYPTPNAGMYKNVGISDASLRKRVQKGHQIDLTMYVRMLPTPTASDCKGGRSLESLKAAGRNGKNSLPDSFAASGVSTKLNPQFVEVLMGYPISHTDLKD